MANIQKVSFVKQAVSPDEMLEQWKIYEDLKTKLRGKDDFVVFRGRDGEMETPTKKWRVKLERFFGISVEIIDIKETHMKNDEVLYTVRARATHPSGAYHEAMGVCSTMEKARSGARKYHDALSHAETRAKNRAVFEFVGMGEVSAEEMEGTEEEEDTITPKQRDYLKHLLVKKVHKSIDMAEKILNINIDTIRKDDATRLIEKLKDVITIDERERLVFLARKVGFKNGDFKEFLKDNGVNSLLIPKSKYDELTALLEGMME